MLDLCSDDVREAITGNVDLGVRIVLVAEPMVTVPNALSQDYARTRLSNGACTGRMSQRERKANIYVAARQLLATHDREQITLKQIADTAGVCVQTVYNLAGNGQSAVADALLEHGCWMIQAARTARNYPNFLFALVDVYCATSTNFTQYFKPAVRTYATEDYVRMRPFGVHEIEIGIHEFKARNALRENVNIRELACRLIGAASSVTFEWAAGLHTDASLRENLMSTFALLLFGAVTIDEAKRMDAWMNGWGPSRFQGPVKVSMPV